MKVPTGLVVGTAVLLLIAGTVEASPRGGHSGRGGHHFAGSKGRGGHGFRAHPGPGHQRAFKAHPGFRGHVQFKGGHGGHMRFKGGDHFGHDHFKFFGPRRHFHKHVAPPVVLFAPAPIYVAPPAYYWYWCQNPAGYYPYVPQCLGAWIPVVPH